MNTNNYSKFKIDHQQKVTLNPKIYLILKIKVKWTQNMETKGFNSTTYKGEEGMRRFMFERRK